MSTSRRRSPLSIIGPGILVAATGVGAGDLATAAFTGGRLGVAVLWAVLLGAALKFVLNEGLARWQLATGETLLEGAVGRFGGTVSYLFLLYLFAWSFFVGSALMSACGVAAHAILPLWDAPTDKIVYGIAHSGIAVLLVLVGGFRLFERVMSVCIGVMFATVLATAVAVGPDWSAVAAGLFTPRIPDFDGQGLQWTIALMGGVGGTLTVLCYGYWIREEGRSGPEEMPVCRWDLATGYLMTALFGVAMVILGSEVDAEGQGARLVVLLADRLEEALGASGPAARWAFLIGAWGAVASSLLGVWQSVPYLYADFAQLRRGETLAATDLTKTRNYRVYLLAIASVPAIGLWADFQSVQKVYAIVGAAFIPLLAVVLLILNSQSRFIGDRLKNTLAANMVLSVAILFFALAAGYEIYQKVSG